MISTASDRLARVSGSHVALKSSLEQLLSLLCDVIQSAEDIDATVVSLSCIAKLSRVHGKAELPLFENVLPVIVTHGIRSTNNKNIQNSADCLLGLLYYPPAF